MPNTPRPRPEIRFVGGSTDADKIRFFGTLMPALLLLTVLRTPGLPTTSPTLGIGSAPVSDKDGMTLLYVPIYRDHY